MEKEATQVGVIIGRFQVPDLHKGQRDLISEVFRRHKKVLILLGVSPVKLSRNNPLDYMTREIMLKRTYPKAVVLPIKDQPDDNAWSKMVDEIIMSAIGDDTVTMYGSRDSFKPAYTGRFPVVELPSSIEMTGTATREAASKEVRASREYRTGVIYASYNRYPISYQCVDAVIWKKEGDEIKILFGRKKTDFPGQYRLIGGFVSPTDESMEAAVMREAVEETGLSLHKPEYLFSVRVEDWRYRKEKDKILTGVFSIQYFFGKESPQDDIDELQWMDPMKLQKSRIVLEHRAIMDRVNPIILTYKGEKQ